MQEFKENEYICSFDDAKIVIFSFPQNLFRQKTQNSQILDCPFPQNSQKRSKQLVPDSLSRLYQIL